MKEFCIKNVGVDAGLIMICDKKYYDKWGNKTNYSKNEYGVVCSQKIKVEPGTYRVKWSIENTWNGPISGEGTVKTDSGAIAISDPCYCIRDWDKWLEDTKMGNDVSNDVVLIDEMGGDGEYEVNLELTKKEGRKMVEKYKTSDLIEYLDDIGYPIHEDRPTVKDAEKLNEIKRRLLELDRNKKELSEKKVTISKSEMQSYENCRTSGVTNMFNVKLVERITGLSKEKLSYIMEGKNYSNLMQLHNIERR